MEAVAQFLACLGICCAGVGFLIRSVAYAFQVRREWADEEGDSACSR